MYTISGAQGLGAGGSWSAIKDFTAITQAVASSPTVLGVKPAPAAVSPVRRLQSALKSLGVTKGDPTLSKLKVDGVVGPGTTKAVNYAIAQRYVVMANFPRPELTVQHVRQYASGIAAAVENAVKAGGGALLTVSAAAPARARGGGGIPAMIPEAPAPESSNTWVWWAAGGLGVLVLLGIAAKLVRGGGRSESPSARRRREAEDER